MQPSNYKKKPVVIQAIQLTWENWNDICNFVTAPWFKRGVYVDEDGKVTEDGTKRLGLEIETLEGTHLAIENDYIIKGIKDEFYPCKPEIFEASYELVP